MAVSAAIPLRLAGPPGRWSDCWGADHFLWLLQMTYTDSAAPKPRLVSLDSGVATL